MGFFDRFRRDAAMKAPSGQRKAPPPKITLPSLDVSGHASANLGHTMRDKVTGYEGVVVLISHEIDGSLLVGIQPPRMEDGKPAEVHEFDVERLEQVEGPAPILNTTNDVAKKSIQLGARYRDAITGYEGVCVRRIDFLGGCVRLTLRPKHELGEKPENGVNIALETAELVDESGAAEAAAKATPTGGPGSSDRGVLARLEQR